ncbi:MAG: protoglobin domain-containing protein, partial [Bacilli bacterium]
MIFSKKRERAVFHGTRGMIAVSDETLKKQLSLLALTGEELGVLQQLQPIIAANIAEMTKAFYSKVLAIAELKQIIEQHSSIERLERTLSAHILTMFAGKIDEGYVAQRNKIAAVHLHIGLEPKWYLGSFQVMLDVIVNAIAKSDYEEKEKFRGVSVVTKILNFEQQIVIDMYEKAHLDQEAQLQQEQLVQQQQLHKQMTEVSEELLAISEET